MGLSNNRKSLAFAAIAGMVLFTVVGIIVLPNSSDSDKNNSKVPKYEYVAAKKDITAGDVIQEEDIEIKEFPFDFDAHKKTGEVIGREAKSDIKQGKPVMKAYIKKIEIVKTSEAIVPREGFRAIPILIKKSELPPYIVTGKVFDLHTKENSMAIENLRVLDLVDSSKNSSNKMLIAEIKESDVNNFIKYLVSSKGLYFLQKNDGEYGEYKFHDNLADEIVKSVHEQKKLKRLLNEVNEPLDDIPSIDTISDKKADESFSQEGVEVIIGNKKSNETGF